MRLLVLEFFIENIDPSEFKGKRILEVGSKDVNGSVRPLIERFCLGLGGGEYIGTDKEAGKYVDLVLPVHGLVDHFGPDSFDVVICTETMEHILDWRDAINNMKAVLRPGGYIWLTTVDHPFSFHAYPSDYWRFSLSDIERIFSDFEILKLRKDVEHGVLLKARKPLSWNACDLKDIELYSMVLGRRTKEIVSWSRAPLQRRLKIRAVNILTNAALLAMRNVGGKLRA